MIERGEMMETYQDFINNILETRGRFNCGDEYHEKHHIIPKCMDGTDDEDNLIDLYAKEHFIAHKLLALENKENDKLQYAWWCMCSFKGYDGKRIYDISAEDYEEARIRCSEASKNRVVSEEVKERMRECMSGENNPMYGIKRSDEVKRKIRDKLLGVSLSDERRKNMSEAHKGIKFSEEHKKHIRENHADSSGENNPHYGKHHSQETKDKIGKANTGENNHRSFCVYSPELDESFWGLRAVQKKYGIDPSCISRHLKGKQKYAGNHPVTGEPLTWVKLENK